MFPLSSFDPITILPVLLLTAVTVGVIWLVLGLAPRVRDAVSIMVHGVVWLVILFLPYLFIASFVSDAMGVNASDVVAFLPWVLLLPILVWVWLKAILRRWSLKWPLIIAAIVAWPASMIIFIVTMIGVAKLIIWAVGRGSTLAASRMAETGTAIRPCSMTESTTNEW